MAPAAREYLDLLAGRIQSVLGESLVGVYAGGSWALGGYLPGRSDLDVAAVARDAVERSVLEELVSRVRHEVLPCPARGLELVVYSRAAAGAGDAAAGFELNLNSGREMPTRIEYGGETAEQHWYAIDRAILADCGVPLAGPPAGEVFRGPPREVLLQLLADSLRWHAEAPGPLDDAVLNACRALRFAREGRWSTKDVAGKWMLAAGNPGPAVAQALRVRHGVEGPVDRALASAFLDDATAELLA